MTKSTECVDCKAIAPNEDTRYTLIGSGWRVSKRETPEGIVVEWRCGNCWREFKATRSVNSTGEFPAASSNARIRAAKRTE
jgi:hypothetical protein